MHRRKHGVSVIEKRSKRNRFRRQGAILLPDGGILRAASGIKMWTKPEKGPGGGFGRRSIHIKARIFNGSSLIFAERGAPSQGQYPALRTAGAWEFPLRPGFAAAPAMLEF